MGKKHKKYHKYDRNDVEEERDEKPLKLVLKVGTPDTREDSFEADTPERRHKHKKKKKHKDKKYEQEQPDRKRKREPVEVSDEEEEAFVPKKPFIKQEDSETVRKDESERKIALKKTMEFLRKNFQGKDPNGFFAYPVTDAIAPLYSAIIKQPMDFTTIKEKIEEEEYNTLAEFRADFKLMCDNAMTYNHPETIYYKEAQKILTYGLKQLTKEKMLVLKRTLTFITDHLDEDIQQLGEEALAASSSNGTAAATSGAAAENGDSSLSIRRTKKPKPSKFEAIPDRMSPEAILAQARAAAKEAADNLTLRKPATPHGFLRRQSDGTTTMTILNTDNDGKVSSKEKIVNLGQLIGRIQAGSGILTGLKEDKRNKANPVSYLNYGPFASYAPMYDSTTANVSKEESDLLLSTYGDETGVEYSKSLREYVADSGNIATIMVDPWLDILTQGEHSRTLKAIEEREKREAAEKEAAEKLKAQKEEELKNSIDFKSLRTLSDIGIDVSFIDHFERELASKEVKQEEEDSATAAIQKKLDETGEMLNDLQKTQHQRLSQKLPPHLAMLPGPSEKEAKLANKVIKDLAELAKQAQPQHVVPKQAVRKALGINSNLPDGPETQRSDQAQPAAVQTVQSEVSEQPPVSQSQPTSQPDQSEAMQDSNINQSEPATQMMNNQPQIIEIKEEGGEGGIKEETGIQQAGSGTTGGGEGQRQEETMKMEEEVKEEGGSVGKDSMDQELDDVLDELEEMGGEDEGDQGMNEEGGADEMLE